MSLKPPPPPPNNVVVLSTCVRAREDPAPEGEWNPEESQKIAGARRDREERERRQKNRAVLQRFKIPVKEGEDEA